MNRFPAPLLSLLLLASPLLLTGCHKTATDAAEEDTPAITVSVTKAHQQTIEETVFAQGVLTAAQGGSARVTAPLSARLKTITVREGDTVTAGQVVALLDTRSQTAQQKSAAAAYRASTSQAKQAELTAEATARDQKSTLHLARLALSSAMMDRTSAIKNAQTALDLARTDLAKTNAGARPQEIIQAEDTLKQAEATRSRADTEAKRQRFLFEKGVSARRQVDDAETALTVAESGVESAQQTLTLLKNGARPEDRAATQLRVRQAEEALQQARTAGDAKVAQARATVEQAEQAQLQVTAKQQEVRAAQDNTAKAAADLSAATVQTDYGVVRAPLSGVVTRRNLNPGDMSDPTLPILEIADIHRLDLVANLTAEDGQRVRPGMLAHLTLSDTPTAASLPAHVLGVGQIDPQTNLLPVRLRLSNPNGKLKSGTFVTADIVVHTLQNAVVVPKETLLTRDGKSIVFTVDEEGIAHETEVKVGAEEDGQVALLSGVRNGDTIVSLGQYELEDGRKVTVAPK